MALRVQIYKLFFILQNKKGKYLLKNISSFKSSPFNFDKSYKQGWFFDISQLTKDDVNSLLNKGDISRISSNGLYTYTELHSVSTQSNTITPTNQQQLQIYNTSNFIKIGNASQHNFSGRNYIGDINSTNGFRVSINSTSTRTATFSIVYRSDNRGGRLKVNGVTQNISFASTNWNWGTKEVQVQLRQGTNTIEFYGGYQTEYAPDIAEITVTW